MGPICNLVPELIHGRDEPVPRPVSLYQYRTVESQKKYAKFAKIILVKEKIQYIKRAEAIKNRWEQWCADRKESRKYYAVDFPACGEIGDRIPAYSASEANRERGLGLPQLDTDGTGLSSTINPRVAKEGNGKQPERKIVLNHTRLIECSKKVEATEQLNKQDTEIHVTESTKKVPIRFKVLKKSHMEEEETASSISTGTTRPEEETFKRKAADNTEESPTKKLKPNSTLLTAEAVARVKDKWRRETDDGKVIMLSPQECGIERKKTVEENITSDKRQIDEYRQASVMAQKAIIGTDKHMMNCKNRWTNDLGLDMSDVRNCLTAVPLNMRVLVRRERKGIHILGNHIHSIGYVKPTKPGEMRNPSPLRQSITAKQVEMERRMAAKRSQPIFITGMEEVWKESSLKFRNEFWRRF